jgi:hypothetical protein
MEKRGLATTGFLDSDREKLQKAFDEEAKIKAEEERAARLERSRRRALQEGLRKRRQLMERTLQEEQDELSKNYQVGMVIDLIKDNSVEPAVRLDVNSITARSLAKALTINSTVTCLDLSSNELNDHAGSYLARALKRNNALKKIELDNNQLGRKTISALGDSLRTNTSLVTLSLDSNPLFVGYENEAEAIGPLKEALRVNKTLTSLNLWRTGIGSLHGAMLANAVEANDTLLFCDVGHNEIDLSDVKRIADKLDANLAAYEAAERIRRAQALTEEEKRKKIQAIEDVRTELWLMTILSFYLLSDYCAVFIILPFFYPVISASYSVFDFRHNYLQC